MHIIITINFFWKKLIMEKMDTNIIFKKKLNNFLCKKIATNIIFKKKTEQFLVVGLQIEFDIFFVLHNGGDEMFL
jgi:hypothetical protein